MSPFAFTVTDETRKYCDEVVRCLIDYGKKDREDAVALVNQFWVKRPWFDDDDSRLHEAPYFWAMCIIHHPKIGDNYPSWWDDPKYWPPPPEFNRRWYGKM